MNLLTIPAGANKQLIIGTVKKFLEGTYKDSKTQEEKKQITVTVTGDVWDPEKKDNVSKDMDVIFRDSDFSLMNYGQDWSMLATKFLERYNEGDLISVLVSESNEKLFANRSKKFGEWVIKKEDAKPITVLIGTVIPSKTNKVPTEAEPMKCWRASIPVSQGQDNPSKFISVTFWDNEADGEHKESLMATRASKVLFSSENEAGEKQYKKAVCVCGEVKDTENNGQVYHNATAYRFYLI